MRTNFVKGWILLLATVLGVVADPAPDPAELPRIPAKSLEEAQKAFVVREGFRVELAAGEPEVVDPVSIAFDEAGRMFVVEMRGYPERREEALGRVKLLEDSEGDGRYEKAIVFAKDLKWPTGVVCWKGGVFVTASPDIIYLGDSDGDGVSDERRVVFTGFGAGQNRLNMQALVNGLQWGPDGRIYGSTAGNGGVVTAPGSQSKPVNLRGSDFSFDPEKLDLRAESGTGQYGLAFDDFGRRYLCSNSRHVIAVMYSWPWNGVGGLPHPLADIAVDGGAAEVFRLSQVEPWRVVRTRWRVQGLVGGPVEGGGRAAGYFTSASGLTVYRGDALPEEFRGNVFVGDVGSNLVHRKVIDFPKDRVQAVARRAGGEEKREFLASTDNWFRPVQCANGPDGALYIVDMCRETIEHPWSIPESIKKHLDLYSGNDRGRIWRVVPEGFQRRKVEVAVKEDPLGRYVPLRSGNGWTRETAARLLRERNHVSLDASLILPLKVGQDTHDETRYAALWLAAERGELERLASDLWHDRHTAVRALAVRKLARHADDLRKMAADSDPRVRFAVALQTLDEGVKADASLLSILAERAEGDPWILRTVAVAAGRRNLLEEVAEEQDRLESAVALLRGGRGWKGGELASLFARAARVMGDDGAPASERRAALWLLGQDGAMPTGAFWKWVDEGDPDLASRAAEVLATRSEKEWEAGVLERWTRMGPGLRGKFLSRMGPGAILSGVQDGIILEDELGFQRRRSLLTHADVGIRKRAKQLLSEVAVQSRKAAGDHYRRALLMKGVLAAGEEVFAKRCAVCHEGKEGRRAIGPDLATLKNKGAPMLLENIIDPNREVASQYQLWTIALKNSVSESGMIAEETAGGFTVYRADGSRVEVAKDEVERLTNLNRSLMPAGLEAGLSLQEMANLLAFLTGRD